MRVVFMKCYDTKSKSQLGRHKDICAPAHAGANALCRPPHPSPAQPPQRPAKPRGPRGQGRAVRGEGGREGGKDNITRMLFSGGNRKQTASIVSPASPAWLLCVALKAELKHNAFSITALPALEWRGGGGRGPRGLCLCTRGLTEKVAPSPLLSSPRNSFPS